MARAVLAGKISGPYPLGGKKGRDLGATLPENIFDHALFSLRNRLFWAQRLALTTRRSFVDKRAKMTESRQNYREITVQDVNITETTEARSPLTFRNLL